MKKIFILLVLIALWSRPDIFGLRLGAIALAFVHGFFKKSAKQKEKMKKLKNVLLDDRSNLISWQNELER